jgi:hypothetical protein
MVDDFWNLEMKRAANENAKLRAKTRRGNISHALEQGHLKPRDLYALFVRGATKNKAPTQNYIRELEKLDKSTTHAVGRFRLQLARLKARPNLASHASHVRRAHINVQRAKLVSEEVKKQLADAKAGRWVERAIAYTGPGSWSYVPGVNTFTKRLTARFAARNALLGSPTLNAYHAKHAARMTGAQAALNKLAAGKLVLENEARLLKGQLARVQHKKQRQGLLFDWEKKLLANQGLVKQVASNYAKPLNNYNNGMSQANRNMLTRFFGMIDAANTKLWRGQALTPDEIAALQFRNQLMGRS